MHFMGSWTYVIHRDKFMDHLYILLFSCLCSIHGLIRGENMELGRDSDTGGQVLTVISFSYLHVSVCLHA
jgi:hypothetical protein